MLTGHLPELMLLLVVALIIFGPKRLPEIGSSLGKAIRDFKTHVSDLGDHTMATPEATTPVQPTIAPVSYLHPENETVAPELVTRV